MSAVDQGYVDLISSIDGRGYDKKDRTGVGSRSIFGTRLEFDISNGQLPLLTLKKVYTRAIVHELLWMLSGTTDLDYLIRHNIKIWDSWVDPETAEYDSEGNLTAGDCPKVYGKQWRNWEDTRIIESSDWIKGDYEARGFKVVTEIDHPVSGKCCVIHRSVDQIARIVDQLKRNPDSRRIVLSAWNVAEVEEMALPPCHTLAQFWTRALSLEERLDWFRKNRADDVALLVTHDDCDAIGVPKRALSCQLYQRSCDMGLGAPFNYVQYALLTHLLAHVSNMATERFIWVGGDTHYYHDQEQALEKVLGNEPLESNGVVLWLNPEIHRIDEFKYEDIEILNYHSHPPVKFPPAAV